jgi:hypothetical protein
MVIHKTVHNLWITGSRQTFCVALGLISGMSAPLSTRKRLVLFYDKHPFAGFFSELSSAGRCSREEDAAGDAWMGLAASDILLRAVWILRGTRRGVQ